MLASTNGVEVREDNRESNILGQHLPNAHRSNGDQDVSTDYLIAKGSIIQL